MTPANPDARDGEPLRFTIVTHFEPIPTETEARPMRAGLLAAALADRGHDVTWWTPDFDHYLKRHRTGGDADIAAAPGLRIRLLKSLGYRRHVGLRRLLHHRRLADRWRRQVVAEPRPDLLLSGWPTPEFAAAVVDEGRRLGVPAVVDIRDLWPDLWLDVLPGPLRPAGRLALAPYVRAGRQALRGATAIVGVTDEYVNWGLRRAGRARTELDRAFAFRFRPRPLDDEGRAAALAALADRGWRPDDRLQLVFAGAFGRTYGLDLVLDAAKEVDRIAPGAVRFVLCGSGDRWIEIERRARDLDSVLVLPRVGVAELSAIYERSDLGIAPYDDIENFRRNVPNKIDEYLGVGLPVVAGVGGLIADLIDREGVGARYAPDDPTSLARLAADLASDRTALAAMRDRVQAHRRRTDAEDELGRYADHLVTIARRHAAGGGDR